MSGETEKSVSGWTVDTLHATLQHQIDALQIRLDERYLTQTKMVETAFLAQQTSMQTAFAAAEKAVDQRATTLDREFHEHLEQVRHENALAFVNADKAVQAALLSSKEATHAALTSSKEAITKAETAAEKRFESVNEFRAQLADQAATFVSRLEADARRAETEVRIAALAEKHAGDADRNAARIIAVELALTSRLDLNDGRLAGMSASAHKRGAEVQQMVGIAGVVLVVVSIAVAVMFGMN